MSDVAITLPCGFALRELAIPDLPDPLAAQLFDAIAALDREESVRRWGYDDLAAHARDLVADMRSQQYTATRRFVVVDPADEDHIVGHLLVLLPMSSNTHLAEIFAMVRASSRGCGIGRALVERGEQIAREAGRTVVCTVTEDSVEPPAGPGTVTATTGVGRVSTDHPGVRCAVARGYVLEQVERHSMLELAEDGLPVPHPDGTRPDITRLADAARRAAGPGYRLHTWSGPTPERWLGEVAVLRTRMSTDAPMGGVDFREDPWDSARVRDWERELAEQGQELLLTAAEDAATGSLAAFTLFLCPSDRPEFVWQGDTLALREHRGRSLGMLVKTANLKALTKARPATRRIHTGNAEENRHMLAINVAMGFRAAGGWGLWQRRLTT